MTKKITKKEVKKKNKTLVLLDTHAILHRAYHALPDFTSPTGEPTGALYGVVAMLLRIIEDVKPDYIVACYDLPEPTHRHLAYDKYKAGRAKTDDTLITQIIKSRDIFDAFGIPIYELAGFEADDMLGTIVAQVKNNKNLDVVIASGDMDTFQLVDKKRVQIYMQRKGAEVALYDEKAIKKKYGFGPLLTIDYKGLRGDTSDNIPGVPGVGETTAIRLVGKYGSIEKIYKAIEKEGVEAVSEASHVQKRFIQLVADHEEEAQFSKSLATIRLDAPIHFTLPKKHWIDAVDTEKTFVLFAELGFRTLASRVRTHLGDTNDTEVTLEGEVVDEGEVEKAAIALWLLESDTTNPTLDDILAYARVQKQDADFKTAKKLIFDELKAQKLDTLYTDVEEPLISILKGMRTQGIILDTTYLKVLSKKMHTELSALESAIYAHAGTEFNINSPKQLSEILYDTMELKPKNQKRTSTGQRSTKESELEKLKDDHNIIPEILRYRELQKLVSTYVDNLPEMVDKKDGRLHPTFLQAGAVTGRMATTKPSIQNIPVRTEEGRAIRHAFVAEKGYALVAIDYSQVELRIAAFLSHDTNLIDIFKRGEDIHRGVASRVFGVNADKVTADMRRRAKVINFGILYGMGVNALRSNLGEGTTRSEAQEFLNAYFNTFTRLAEYLEETKVFARTHGYTETFFGRRRHFPGINSGAPFIRAQAERMAINAPVQGTSADITRIAMVTVQRYIKEHALKKDVRMLLQVHDELVFEINKKKVSELVPVLIDLMTGMFTLEETRGVPILADAKIGDNWGEMNAFSS